MEEEGEIAAFWENPSPTVGGFDFVFVSELSEDQKCPICLVAMRNPVQTRCGHRFCESCLLTSIGDDSKTGSEPECPRDREPIPQEGGWFNDRAWEREILSLCVKCKKSERGCEWTGEIRHYQTNVSQKEMSQFSLAAGERFISSLLVHKEKKGLMNNEKHFVICQYEDTTCDECLETMYRGIFDIHTTSQCPNRIIQCVYCKEDLEFWQKEIHHGEICKSFPCPCPQECGMQEIPREEMESHVQYDCIMTLVPCPYKEAGCSFYDKRNSLEVHLNASVGEHLIKTWSKFLRTTERLNRSKTELKSMKKRLDQLDETEDELRELQVENTSIRERLTNLEWGNCDLHTNTKSVTKRLSELENGQPKAIEAAKESMKTLLDQKVTDIISECRSSQEKGREENTLLKVAVAELQKKLEEAKSNNASTVAILCRYVQAVYSEITTQREPGKEKTDAQHDLMKRRNAAINSGNTSVIMKKTRIEEADKCKTDCATKTANGQPSRLKETSPTFGSDSDEDSR